MLGDSTGYEINKLFEDGLFSHFMDASYGSIYPALTRLTEQGMLTCTAEAQDGRPDKKVYSLTEQGRQALRDALMSPLSPDKYRSEFVFASLFASMLPGQRVKVRLRVATLRDAVVVPQTAIIEHDGNFAVTVVRVDNTTETRWVETGEAWRGLRVIRFRPEDNVRS